MIPDILQKGGRGGTDRFFTGVQPESEPVNAGPTKPQTLFSAQNGDKAAAQSEPFFANFAAFLSALRG
jgi:hypothetical protein